MTQEKIIQVFVTLLEEGTDTIRETEAIDLRNGLYKLLPPPGMTPRMKSESFNPAQL